MKERDVNKSGKEACEAIPDLGKTDSLFLDAAGRSAVCVSELFLLADVSGVRVFATQVCRALSLVLKQKKKILSKTTQDSTAL